jgi:predicted amidohydrolase
MTANSRIAIATVLVTLAAGAPSATAADGRALLPGRQVKVAAIAIGFGGNHDRKLRLGIEHLETAGRAGVDIACLPEEFAGTVAEAVAGPTVNAVAEIARKYRMYVVCPIREISDDGRQYNTAVLLDRQGRVAGRYRKMFVYWGEGVHLGRDGAALFDTDFGRIAILTCFDLNFDELWQEAERKGAEIVFWPSAYGGGLPLAGYAMIHNYYVVAVGRGTFIDNLGRTIDAVEKPRPQQLIATLDLDRTLIHSNFNKEKLARMLREHRGEIVEEQFLDAESWHVLRAIKPGVRVGDLCKQYQIETLREYRHRSREQINDARAKDKPI